MKISIIGGGTMGEAILSALLKKRLVLPENVMVKEVIESRREHLAKMHGIGVTSSGTEAVRPADIIILAVKPQTLPEVLTELSGQIENKQLVISIMAGVKIDTLRDGLRHDRIVRSMPNTPAQIGEGMTIWTATSHVTDLQKKSARNILGVMGEEIYVDDERMIDMATAVSGSGPAYFFLFLEALIDAAVSVGLPPDMAKRMALQTMLGAGLLVEKSGTDPAELRRMVTSPGGTTAEALRVFEERKFNAVVAEAVNAAYKKARILGGERV